MGYGGRLLGGFTNKEAKASIPDTAQIWMDEVGEGSPTFTFFSVLKANIVAAVEVLASYWPTVKTLAAGQGITDGTLTVFRSSYEQVGDFLKTTIYIDIHDLQSSTTDLDIIGTGILPATLGKIEAAKSGDIFFGTMTCLKAPTVGVTDIDLYSAVEDTGAFDTGIATLDQTALLTKGGAWSADVATPIVLTALPAADEHLYLTCGAAGTVGAYTAGQFVIELWGAL